jgi:hypothetical protein
MTPIDTETLPRPVPRDLREVEAAVEFMLAEQLAVERERSLPSDLADLEGALDDFADCCDWFGLPGTAHVFAAYIIERRRRTV